MSKEPESRAGEEPEPRAQEEPEPRVQRARRLLGDSRTFLTAVIALIAGGAGLLFDLVPAWKPDPRERVGASLEVFAVEPGVSTTQWLHEAFAKSAVPGQIKRVFGVARPDRGELRFPGTVVYVRVEVDGYKHEAVALRARLYDAESGRRLTPFPPRYTDSSRIEIDAPNRRSVALLFVQDLSEETTKEFVRVTLKDSETGAILAIADSPTLVGGIPVAASQASR